jgi:prepilin-type N-terminal cleavage/methylation domain-containing protein
MDRLPNHFRGGFTLVELMMGLVVMAIIFGALAALSLATGNGWQATESQDNLQVARRQTSTQMYYNIRAAKFIGSATADNSNSSGAATSLGASVIFWKGDKDPGKTMYAWQIAVIEHDLATSTLRLYQLPQTASGAMTEFKDCDVDDSSDVEKFKKISGVTCQVIGRNISSVNFKVLPIGSTRQSQVLEFQIRYKSGEQEQLEYGSATVRVPQAPPS